MKNHNKRYCNHQWREVSVIALRQKSGADVPRRIQICRKCREMIHLPVYTLSQLVRKEIYGENI